MLKFDKLEIRNSLSVNDIYELLTEWGGEPEYTSFGIISTTICHNMPGEGSRKLYYYENSTLFHCYTGCEEPNFDIFQLCIKVNSIQKHLSFDLNDAVRLIASHFGIVGVYSPEDENEILEDWKYFDNYNRIQDLSISQSEIILKEYDKSILNNFNYDVKILPWLEEGISEKSIKHAQVGYYPGGEQITIPHFDKDGRFIGLRGRTLGVEEAEIYGKYRPLRVNQQLYTHPLGMNLYNLNNSKDNIKILGKAIVFESEKSTLQYQSFFGFNNDISVACCGSAISNYQMSLLINSGAKEIIIAFDRQFQKIDDNEFRRLKKNLLKIYSKYKNYVVISFIFDTNMITPYKSSPTDNGKDIFLKLYKERIFL